MFCSWVCPVNAVTDAAAWSRRRLGIKTGRVPDANTRYWLLGGLVERVTGVPFPVYVTRRIFEPLGLTPADAGYLIVDPDRHATGYLERYSILNLFRPLLIDRDLIGSHHGPWVEVHAHYADGPAFGGVVCTARALGTLLTDQLRPQSVLLDHAMQSLLYTAERPFEGATWPVTAGWHVAERGTFGTYFFKEGGGGGFHGMMRLYRERGRGSVLVTNATAFDVNDGLDALDAVLLVERGHDERHAARREPICGLGQDGVLRGVGEAGFVTTRRRATIRR